MRELKNNNLKKYQKERKEIKDALYKIKKWDVNSLIELIDYSYKISSYLYRYYKCFQDKSSKALVELQNVKSNPTSKALEYYALWKILRAISIAEMQNMYDILGVNLSVDDIRGESFYSGIPQPTSQDLEIGRLFNNWFDSILEIAKEFLEEPASDEMVPLDEGNEEDYTDYIPGPDGVVYKFCHMITDNNGDYVYFRR